MWSMRDKNMMAKQGEVLTGQLPKYIQHIVSVNCNTAFNTKSEIL